MPVRMHDDEVPVDEALVRRLLVDQLPALAGLPLQIVEPWGTDNAIWRHGDDLVVRLPRIAWAAGQADKEATWLPALAPHLTVAIPTPVAVGAPTDEYPFRWAVHRWLPGQAPVPSASATRSTSPQTWPARWPSSGRFRSRARRRPTTAPARSRTTTLQPGG